MADVHVIKIHGIKTCKELIKDEKNLKRVTITIH